MEYVYPKAFIYEPCVTRNGHLMEQLMDYRDELGDGGIDIIVGGDSIPVTVLGQSGPSYQNDQRFYASAIAQMRRYLQHRLNGSVKGGPGWIPFTNGSTTYGRYSLPCNSISGPTPGTDGDTYSSTSASMGPGGRQLGLAANKTRYAGINFQGLGTTAVPDKEQAKDIYLCYRQYSGGPYIYLDHAVSSWPSKDAGTIKHKVNTDGATNYMKRDAVLSFSNAAATNRITVRGGDAAQDVAYPHGVFAINEDAAAGIRVHDFCNPGSLLSAWSEESLVATIDSQATRDGAICANGRILVWSTHFNDANNYPTTTLQGFYDAYEAIVTRAIAQGYKAIILVIGQEPLSTALSGTNLVDAWRPMRQSIYDLQEAYSDYVSIWDQGALFDFAAMSAAASNQGFVAYPTDTVHMSLYGHAYMGLGLGKYIASLLTA